MVLTDYYSVLRRTSLLRGFTDAELTHLMTCFAPRVRRYEKGEILLMAGYETPDVGIVLDGRICAVKTTPDGSNVVITQMEAGGVFGDVLAGSHQNSPVTVLAMEPCSALFLPTQKILRPCGATHEAHYKLLQNLVATISDKYFSLDRRVELLICKSLRARLCLWLLEEAARQKNDTFTVPLTRAGLAEYLNCDRSALSRELSRVAREGLIETYRSSFKLLNKDALREQTQEGKV